jgi:hypothetical protein
VLTPVRLPLRRGQDIGQPPMVRGPAHDGPKTLDAARPVRLAWRHEPNGVG